MNMETQQESTQETLAAAALESARAGNIIGHSDIDQDWDNETTVYKFSDGSKIIDVCGVRYDTVTYPVSDGCDYWDEDADTVEELVETLRTRSPSDAGVEQSMGACKVIYSIHSPSDYSIILAEMTVDYPAFEDCGPDYWRWGEVDESDRDNQSHSVTTD